VPGLVRLSLEVVYFVTAVWLLAAADRPTGAAVLGGLILFHYLASYDRLLWLLRQR
jgi:hypothetical protein